jgi:branched-chain amino acid aminotransferase
MTISIEKNQNPKPVPTGDYGFGSIFTPHMFRMDYSDGAWGEPKIVPYGPFVLDPACKVLHYGQEIFEGMKAYKNPEDNTVHMFRPDKNVQRFNISCERMCMPTVDETLFMDALNTIINLDRAWVPESPNALYIRPTMISTQVGLGVKASTDYIFYIIIGPVGSYFAGGINPLRLRAEERFVRSAQGGVGFAKTGGNYASALLPIQLAQQDGFDQIIWLDAKEMAYVEEMGAMNIAFVYDDKIITAPTGDTILNGVTRDSVGILLGDMGYNWVEEAPAIAQICEDARSGKLKEVFACGTAAVVTPVGMIHYKGADHQIADGGEGTLTEKLRKTLTGIHTGTADQHPEWVQVVPQK